MARVARLSKRGGRSVKRSSAVSVSSGDPEYMLLESKPATMGVFVAWARQVEYSLHLLEKMSDRCTTYNREWLRGMVRHHTQALVAHLEGAPTLLPTIRQWYLARMAYAVDRLLTLDKSSRLEVTSTNTPSNPNTEG